MTKQAVTIYDIAYQAKVSQSTVSRVLSGSTRVSPEKREAVLEAVRQLNYRPNVAARGLARGRSHVIGVLTLERADPFFGSILVGIERGLRGTGYHALTASVAGHEDTRRALDLLLATRVDALVIVGAAIRDERLPRLAYELPVAAVGPSMPGLEDHCLHADNEVGAYHAAKHLLELGHRRIAHVRGPSGHRHADDRFAGVTRALAEAALSPDPALTIEASFDEPSGMRATEELLARGAFTALIAGNDQIAFGAMVALHRRGLRIPTDVSLVGFDDQPHAAFTTPPLTTVRQPTPEMGASAVQGLVAMLGGEDWQPPRFSAELVVRESTSEVTGP